MNKVNIVALSIKWNSWSEKINWYIHWIKYFLKTNGIEEEQINVMYWKTSQIYLSWEKLFLSDNQFININEIDYLVYWWKFYNLNITYLLKIIEDNWWQVITSYKNNPLFFKANQYLDIQSSELWQYYPETRIIFKTLTEKYNEPNSFKKQILKVAKDFGNEFVIKCSDGSDGDEVELIKNEQDLDKYIELIKERGLKWAFLIQKKINCKPWFDYRWYVVKDKLVSLVNRVNLDWGFKSNTKQWNVITQYVDFEKQDEELKKLVSLILEHYKKDNLRYYWFDILKDEQTWKYYFIEINIIAWYMKARDKDWNIIMNEIAEKIFDNTLKL